MRRVYHVVVLSCVDCFSKEFPVFVCCPLGLAGGAGDGVCVRVGGQCRPARLGVLEGGGATSDGDVFGFSVDGVVKFAPFATDFGGVVGDHVEASGGPWEPFGVEVGELLKFEGFGFFGEVEFFADQGGPVGEDAGDAAAGVEHADDVDVCGGEGDVPGGVFVDVFVVDALLGEGEHECGGGGEVVVEVVLAGGA